MADYKNTQEYWEMIDYRYRLFAGPEDRVEVTASYRATGKCCLCGHEIVNNIEITNRRTGEIIVMGSNCINNRLKIEKRWWDIIEAQMKADREKAGPKPPYNPEH